MSEDTAFEVGRLFEPISQIAATLVASQKDIFVRLPGLVGYWPMGIRGNGNVYEHGGSGITLTQTGVCPAGYDGNSFAHIGNGVNYVQSASTLLGLTGLETWVSSSLRGLTLGGWFMIDTLPGGDTGLASRDGAASDRGYGLFFRSTSKAGFFTSGTGGATQIAESGVTSISEWHFIVGRFTPSAETAVFVDGDKSVNTTAIPASQFVSTANFEVGRIVSADANITHCKVRDAFVCATVLSDALIEETRVSSAP